MTDFGCLILAAELSPAWMQTLGRFHVAVVHFPIALLLVAGVVELWRSVRRNKQPSRVAIALLAVGGFSAALSSALGWIHKGFTGFGASDESSLTLALHQWMGIGAAAFACIALIGLLFRGKDRQRIWPYRGSVLLCAALVGAAGHFGGTLTHGPGYLTEMLNAPADVVASATPQAAMSVVPVMFPADGKVTFARDVQPLLQHACLDCHGPAKHRNDLRLDTKEAALKGGAHGPALVVGKPDDSLLIQYILGHEGKRRMPMGRDPLNDAQVKILRTWIEQGAEWSATSTIASSDQKVHWAYVKPKHPDLPTVTDSSWSKNPIDYFVLARLEKEGLKPSPEADRVTLIRRLSLDLIGLPPTPEEVDAFVNDSSPNAYEQLVSRLLASPHYGERWGRHWLDIARYADTNGYEKDNPRVIWPYRDWVINALNRDMTFDQFVINQIAGDMLPGTTAEDQVATGFHRNTMFNEEGGIDAEEFRYKAVVDRVQTTATAFLGLTMHCAQCHNHKYDDISQKEYFSFFALMNNADEPFFNLPDPAIADARRTQQENVDKLKSELASKFPPRDESIQWEVLSPDVFATTQPSTELALRPDGSLFATGPVPETDEYIVEADANLDGVTAFRLETLIDTSLPGNGPGRKGAGKNSKNGNFILSQFKVEQAEPIDPDSDAELKPTRVKIDRAEADYSQKDYEIVKAIDDTFQKGWSVGPRAKDINKDHYAIFYTPEKLSGRKTLVITLKQLYKDHTIGKFRLSVGRPPPPPTTAPTPQDREKFLVQKLGEWEKTVTDKCAKWAVADPVKFERRYEGTITKLADKSLLMTGLNLYREEYQFQYRTDAKDITAIRIEALPHEDLPRGGPGRNINGGFVLSEVTAIASPADKPASTQPVEIESAAADVSPESAERVLDGKKDSHWTVSAGNGKPMEIVLKLKDKLAGFDGGTTISLSMLQNYFQSESLGRVRVSVTSDEDAGVASGVPAEVEEILLTPKDKRTPEQVALVRQTFLMQTPFMAPQQQEIENLRNGMPQFTTTLVMKERAVGRQTRIHHRGEFLQPAEPIEKAAVPAVLPPLPKDAPLTRLTLARWLVSNDNPLVSRVVMNRIWSLYFGRGIVNSIEDFGVMGELPSHPQLLDWLATQFQRENWSMKAMHRLIVTSATYRQASQVTPQLKEKDPQNVLLARGPRFRVEAEIVRDIALASSGLLNQKIGGPSVFPPQPAGITELSYGPLAWNTSVGGDRYRRGMYTFLKRTSLYPGVTTFDGPTADVTCAQRIRSNTPLQALTTMNDEVFVEAAQALARRIVSSSSTDVAERAAHAFRLCVARSPDKIELKAIVDFYEAQKKRFADKSLDAAMIALRDPKKPPAGVDVADLAAWTTVARSILNLDETITKE